VPDKTYRRRSPYAVKLVRGPYVKLSPHRDHCASRDELVDYARGVRSQGFRLAADLFSGAGGLSLGLEEAGFKVVLSADKDPASVETHRHHFGGMALDWDLGDPDRIAEIARLITDAGIDLLAGGPPCQPFSKAGRSMIRYRVQNGLRDPHDERRDLWRSFLEVAQLALPPAVVMENVPDMALDRDMFILRSMVEELEQLGYSVEERVVDAWRYGVPQFRQRLILVALKDGLRFSWPSEREDQVSVWTAIGDMPAVDGGWRPDGGAEGWINYDGPDTEFQADMRRHVAESDRRKLFDHITRPVRDDDREAFEYMTHKTKYSDLEEEHRRYRDDIFDDKYKRLDENDLSRTITAHIAKDGYWYIHPRQSRTLTVREAARLQTFPDDFRFAGPPSVAFRQIGNAVPPRLGQAVGEAIAASLDRGESETLTTSGIAARLARWFRSDRHPLAVPWLRATTRWQVAAAELLLDRASQLHIRSVWPIIERTHPPETATPENNELLDVLLDLVKTTTRSSRHDLLQGLIDHLGKNPGALDRSEIDFRKVPGLTEATAQLAILVVPVDGDTPDEPVLVTKGVLRVARRFQGGQLDTQNKLTDGRLAVARMVGFGEDYRDAHKALIELANGLCRPADPLCSQCPLMPDCRRDGVEDALDEALF
jgi:DNA (cytosine-5)-methyltransferase 1